MRRRVLLCLTLVTSACNGDKVAMPTSSPSGPTSEISDATHATGGIAGNPDFFFLPPMVKDPSGSPLWDVGAFNPALHPTVAICSYDVAIKTEAAVAAGPPCTPMSSLAATVDPTAEQYQTNWKVPSSDVTFYRISVTAGHKTLGYADVETGANASQLKNVATGDFIPLVDGRTLPIKFRIERYALCDHPGDPTQPCLSQAVDLSIGGTVSTVLPGTTQPTGITIPSQGPTAPITNITVQGCDNINPRATDLRVFGPCFRITADNGSAPTGSNVLFTNPATVFSCEVDAAVHAAIDAGTLTTTQEPLVTLHRLDGFGTPTPRLAALQHVPACGKGVASSARSTVAGVLASLAHGKLRDAARQAVGLFAPKPLYAAMFIDLGGGGFSQELSDFQFALPAKMEIVPGVDGLTSPVGAALSPTVKVTDLHGDPVQGALVHFNTADPATGVGTVVPSGPDGLASVPWTIGLGSNTMAVSGRGVASPTNNGPRDGFDPFQPIHDALGFDPGIPDGPEVPVGLGTLAFTVGGVQVGFTDGFEPAADWPGLSGYWHRSTLTTAAGSPFINAAFSTQLVRGGDGDNSGGALPAPFTGARAFWFGSDAYGNYAGPLADASSGGTSTDVRSGTATSPEFFVPASGDVSLVFRSWFEIESVNPSNYDLMRVFVHEVGSATSAEVKRLNPSADPGGNSYTPLTSGGFNQAPVWTQESASLNGYRGKRVVLVFSFDTRDVLYNGFRGWVVDDVSVRSVAGITASATAVPLRASPDVVGSDAPPPPRTWHP